MSKIRRNDAVDERGEALTPIGDEEEAVERQLQLFSAVTFGNQPPDDYSNVIDLYDMLPRYLHNRKVSDDLNVERLIRKVRHRGAEYVMEVTPALLERDGEAKLIFPGQREEVVEHALRKLAINGMGFVHGSQVSVQFRLNDLSRELEKRGHTHSWPELKEAIEVCHNARLKVSSADGRRVASGTIFPVVIYANPNSNDPTEQFYSVRFYPMVTHAVLHLGYRRFDYTTHLSIRNYLARYLHQRLAAMWIQASDKFPYSFGLLSMLSQTARGVSPDMRSNIRAMKMALDVLIEKKVIREYEEERERKGNRVLDIKYNLYPHEDFVNEMKGHNVHARLLRSDAQVRGLESPKLR